MYDYLPIIQVVVMVSVVGLLPLGCWDRGLESR